MGGCVIRSTSRYELPKEDLYPLAVLLAMSIKQKLNTKNSTEAKVVGASDYVLNCIWTGMFMEVQGYKMKESIYYQDNLKRMDRCHVGETLGTLTSDIVLPRTELMYIAPLNRY